MGPLEQERRNVHPTSLPGGEGFPSASSVPATLHSPPSARLLRGSDLVADAQELQRHDAISADSSWGLSTHHFCQRLPLS